MFPRPHPIHGMAIAAALLGGCSLLVDVTSLATDGGAASNLVDERLEGEFGAGTFSGTRWVVDHVELSPGVTSGDFVSRIFDSTAPGVPWKTLSWSPGAPYGKPLPDQALAETGYRAGSFDMAGNVALLHFDGTLVDTSPIQNPFSGTSVGGFNQGVFGSALADTPQGYVHTTVSGPSSVFNFGTGSFSWALWAKSTAPCPGNAVYMGLENPGTGLKPHLWLGCTPGSGSTGVLGDTFCSNRTTTPDDCTDVMGTTPLTDGVWHLMTIVKSGQAPATVSAYLDGALQGSTQNTFSDPLVFDTGVEFAIGAFSTGTYPAEGTFDEVAVWHRALSPQEVVALYQRGALRLSFQVRACDDPACASAQFVGPGGDSAGSFVDPANALGPPGNLAVLANGRYVQYRAHFESDASGQSPALYSVTVAR